MSDDLLLTLEQEAHIQKTICEKCLEQLKMDFFLWSRGDVMQFIGQERRLKLGVHTVGKYFKCWGFTPKKSIKRAYEQLPEAVKAWQDRYYHAIEEQAKAEGGEIHRGDENALVTEVRGRIYAPASNTPVAYTVDNTRQKLSMIATVTNRGKVRRMIIDGGASTVIDARGGAIRIIVSIVDPHVIEKIVCHLATEASESSRTRLLPSRAPLQPGLIDGSGEVDQR